VQFRGKVIGVQRREFRDGINAAGFEELQRVFTDPLDLIEFGHGLS
jgi:hypothetical protein